MSSPAHLAQLEEEFPAGPFAALLDSVKNKKKVVIKCHDGIKLVGYVRSFDHHWNMVLEEVIETWWGNPRRQQGRGDAILMDRYIPRMFLPGHRIIFVIRNPLLPATLRN